MKSMNTSTRIHVRPFQALLAAPHLETSDTETDTLDFELIESEERRSRSASKQREGGFSVFLVEARASFTYSGVGARFLAELKDPCRAYFC